MDRDYEDRQQMVDNLDEDTWFRFGLTVEIPGKIERCPNCHQPNRTLDPEWMFTVFGKTLTCGGCSWPLMADPAEGTA